MTPTTVGSRTERPVPGAVQWLCTSQGLGSTEYQAEIGGAEYQVSFIGDHRQPYDGRWALFVNPTGAAQVIHRGRAEFSSDRPSRAEIDAVLAQAAALAASRTA